MADERGITSTDQKKVCNVFFLTDLRNRTLSVHSKGFAVEEHVRNTPAEYKYKEIGQAEKQLIFW